MAYIINDVAESSRATAEQQNLVIKQHSSGALSSCVWYSKVSNDPSPFPRRNFAYNAGTGRGFDIFLTSGEDERGIQDDLWSIDARTLAVQRTAASGPGPSARTGAQALLVGNAFVVFGGVQPYARHQKEDSSLYLLNTATKLWSVAPITGKVPAPRQGHSLNLIGSRIYVFGGSIINDDGTTSVSNDFWTFDINTLFLAGAAWSKIVNAEQSALMPTARSGHSAITYEGRLYIFAGCNGAKVFDDLWCWDMSTMTWTRILASGNLPKPRHSHSAVSVSGMMFIFGGVDESGLHLNDFVALNLNTHYWHRIETEAGIPRPPARSHSALCSVGSKIYLIGGDVPYPANNDSSIYVVDTQEIRYGSESAGTGLDESLQARLLRSNVYSAPDRKQTEQAQTDSDVHSIASRASDSRSIRSIREDLGQQITAALDSDNAAKALERIFAKADATRRVSAITPDFIGSLDKMAPETVKNEPVKRPLSALSNNAEVARSGSVLKYFRRNKSSGPQALKSSIGLPKNVVKLGGAGKQSDTVDGNPPAQDYTSIDLERFLAMERKMYKELPAFGETANLAPSLVRLDSTQERTRQSDVLRLPEILETNVSTSFAPSIARSIREGSSSMFRRNSAIKKDASSSAGDPQPISDTESLPKNEAPREQVTTAAGGPDPQILLRALTVLRAELKKQKKSLTDERDAAYYQVTIMKKEHAKTIETRLTEANRQHEQTLLSIRQDLSSVRLQKEEADIARSAAEDKIAKLEAKAESLSTEISTLQAARREAEESLLRYTTIEAEAVELHRRQVLQLEVIDRLSTQIGVYQVRANQAEQQMELEAHRCHNAEIENLELQKQIEEHQLKIKHLHRLSSLTQYTRETSAQEAESSRTIMLKGLRDLLNNGQFVKPGSTNETTEQVEELKIADHTTAPESVTASVAVAG